jgi:hypothetical protein
MDLLFNVLGIYKRKKIARVPCILQRLNLIKQ